MDHRNQVERRPDYLFEFNGLVLLRGEEDSNTDITVPCNKLTVKMRAWNPLFYGNLSYIIGYATSGSRLAIVSIDRNLGVDKLVEFDSIVVYNPAVLKTFYNLAFLFAEMIKHSKWRVRTMLRPYKKDINSKRTIELMDEAVQRTILRGQCRDDEDFERLVDIYKTLKDLNLTVIVFRQSTGCELITANSQSISTR